MSGAGQLELLGAAAVAVGGAACGTYALVRSRRVQAEYRRPASLFSASLLVWAVGGAADFVTHLVGSSTTSASSPVATAAYLMATALYSVAMVMHPALAPNYVRLRVVANGVIVATSMVTLLWYGGGRHLYERTGEVLSTIGPLGYPATDVVLISITFAIVVRSGRSRERAAAAARASAIAVATAFTAFLLGDLYHLVTLAHSPQQPMPLVTEAAWLVGFGFLARSMAIIKRDHRSTIRRDDRFLSAVQGTAPVVAAIVAGTAAALDWASRGTVDPTGMLLLTAVVSMVLARQSLTVSDNRRLGVDLHQVVADLERQATHDTLTGLPNRSGLTDRIRAALDSTERTTRRAALLFLDLDHLKPVNDSLGHAAGDILLRTTAQRVVNRVGPSLTRFGGDEFVVVLDDLPASDAIASAELIGRQVVSDTGEPITIEGHLIRPSVSVGVAIAEPGIGPEELMRRADLALYRAKARGRRRVATYDPATEPDARRSIDLEYELRRAIRNDEFEVHYQPVVELATGQIAGVESLLRWRHPDRGLLMPGAFLDEAASCGLLGTIGERTLMRVCADLAPLRSADGMPPPSVSVNLSTTELTDGRLIQRVAAALRTFGMEPSRLVIEITEDVIIDDEIRTSIDALRSLGVHLAIDDFGTGNSSLRQLGTYPAETLKIDRSFIAPLGDDEHHTAIVRAILGLARNLGLRTVAEGVETAEQARQLADLGCDQAQGWLFAPALTLDELVHRLAGEGQQVHRLSALDRRALSGRGAPASLQPRP